eukprot:GHVU01216134.1.p2 GENE.GHVU01216134.1~~GHVU01216134.1.p2  ORF type:complete len:113 (-),score=2.98 GHVU01216134.1:343-681(-)
MYPSHLLPIHVASACLGAPHLYCCCHCRQWSHSFVLPSAAAVSAASFVWFAGLLLLMARGTAKGAVVGVVVVVVVTVNMWASSSLLLLSIDLCVDPVAGLSRRHVRSPADPL